MSRIHRPARIIAPEHPEQEGAGAPRSRRVDYAALLRRRLTPRDPAASGNGDGEAGTAGSTQADPDLPDGDPPDPSLSSGAGGHAGRKAGTLAERIGSVSVPIVEAVYRQQNQFIQLTARVAREVAAFCANRAITRSGNWEVRLPLDPKLLPDTTLYLTLSPLCLQLRFDAQDPSSRQLLLQHSHLLERELTELLDAWGEPRQVDITIW